MPVAPFWDGTLTKADFAMYNFYRIIKFEMFQDTIKTSGILDDINQAVSNYGDTLVFAETNITGLERWDKGRNSTTASTRFLERRFNDSTVPEKARVQYYLAARITTDEAISPHAFDSAEGFNLWRGIVISFLNTAKGAFLVGLNLAEVCGYVNSGAGLTNINFNNTDLAITAEDAATEIEAKLRLQAGRLDSLLSNLFRQMKQNSTKFNNYGYTKAFTEEQVRILINGDWRDMLKYSIYYNRMFSVDGGTERMQGEELPGYLFGIANTNAGTTAGGEASLKHFITVGGNLIPLKWNIHGSPAWSSLRASRLPREMSSQKTRLSYARFSSREKCAEPSTTAMLMNG